MSLSYEISPESVIFLRKINELAQEKRLLINRQDVPTRETIARYARISNIGASTRIENAILTNIEIEWIDETLSKDGRTTSFLDHKLFIQQKLSKDKERSLEEVAGAREVIEIILDQGKECFPLTEIFIRGLHQRLLQYYPKAQHYTGRYKIASNSVIQRIGNEIVRTVLKTADPGPITEAAMRDLVSWYNATLPTHPWSIAVAVEFVFRFLAIHPFQDGNGRLGRALFLLTLLQSPDTLLSEMAPYLAIDRQIERRREEYYLVLRQCSEGYFLQDPKQYKMEHFFRFMLKVIQSALETDIDYYFEKHGRYMRLPPSAKRVLDCFKEKMETRSTPRELEAIAGLPRRTLTYALKSLVEHGFVQQFGQKAGTHYQLIF